MESSCILVYCPFPTLEAARIAASVLLEQRLVACCNLLPAGESHYWWEGKLTQASEVILLAKTNAGYAEQVSALLSQLHPYECPAILSIPAGANPLFAIWLEAQLSPAAQS